MIKEWKFTNFLLLTLLFAILTIFSGCSNEKVTTNETKNNVDINDEIRTEEKKIEKEELQTIKVGTSPIFAPLSYKDENDELVGFEKDAFDEIAKRMGRNIEWVEMGSLDNLFGSLDSGAIDTIAFQISINEERQKNYIFSDTYGYNQIYLTVRKDFKYDTLDDLQGKKVELSPSHSMYPILEKYNKDLPEDKKIKLVIAEGNSMFDSIEQGKVDAGPVTEVGFEAAMEAKPFNLKISGPALVIEENAYPFSKNTDPKLIEDVNTAIKSMMEDGTMREISLKNYKIDITKRD